MKGIAAGTIGGMMLTESRTAFAQPAQPQSTPPAGPKPFIWDLHCHLNADSDPTPAARMDRMVEYADRMGIDRLLVYLGLPPFVDHPTPDQIRKANDETLDAITRYPGRAFGLALVTLEHADASIAEVERCVANGPMLGVKFLVAARCSDQRIDPIVRRNFQAGGICYQHTFFNVTGNRPGESTPADLVELHKRNPDIPLICGHTGGDWELGIRTVRRYPLISIDLAGSDPTNGFVEMAVRELGPERILYGSDVSGRSFASQLGKVMGADVPDEAKRLILGENLRRLTTPILRTKGVEP
jgi:hypothetical protein